MGLIQTTYAPGAPVAITKEIHLPGCSVVFDILNRSVNVDAMGIEALPEGFLDHYEGAPMNDDTLMRMASELYNLTQTNDR